MTFTMLSVALLGTVGAGVLIEVMRALRRGLMRTAMTLATVVFSALAASSLAVWLSDLPLQALSELIQGLMPGIEALSEQFPSVSTLIQAGVDTLLSPILFVLLFLLLRLVTRIVLSALFRGRLKPSPEEMTDPIYESEHAPWYRRHGRLTAGIAGGLCGFMAALILLSPVVGVLGTAHTLLRKTERINVKWSSLGLTEEQISEASATVSEPAVLILEACGGGLVFDAAANTRLNGKQVYLRREVDACMTVLSDMVTALQIIGDPKGANEEERELLSRLGEEIERSEAAKLLAADFLNQFSQAWLEGKTFLKLERPNCGELVDPLLNGILSVCAESTAGCVGRDITTLVHIYLIAAEYGLLQDPDYSELAEQLDEDGVLGKIYDELVINPCMTHLTGELTNMSLRIMARAIKLSNFSDAKLNGLMSDLSDAMNLVNGMGTSYEERVQSMKDYTLYYAEQYGVSLPDSLAEMAAAALVDRLGDSGRLDGGDLREVFDEYMNG